MTTLPLVDKEYSLKFDVYPTSFIDFPASVIRLMVHGGSNNENIGDRIPAIFYHKIQGVQKFRVCMPIDENKNHCYNSADANVVKIQWTTVEIKQILIGGAYKFQILINGNLIKELSNSIPRQFTNVEVYIGSPFIRAQPGFIRNLTVLGEYHTFYLKGFMELQQNSE